MSERIFRPAAASDLPFILGLMTADAVPGSAMATDPVDPADYEDVLGEVTADPHQMLMICECQGRPIGTFQLTLTPGLMSKGRYRATVEAVHVAPTERNSGHGAAMMQWAVETARARGAGVVQLTSNKRRADAHRFYLRLGFAQTHEGFKLYL